MIRYIKNQARSTKYRKPRKIPLALPSSSGRYRKQHRERPYTRTNGERIKDKKHHHSVWNDTNRPEVCSEASRHDTGKRTFYSR